MAHAKCAGNPNWKKGQSGNPGGRPKGEGEVRELARTYTKEAIEKLADWMRSKNPKASVAACTALLDRGWGKPAQSMEVTGKDGAPLTVKVVSYGNNRPA